MDQAVPLFERKKFPTGFNEHDSHIRATMSSRAPPTTVCYRPTSRAQRSKNYVRPSLPNARALSTRSRGRKGKKRKKKGKGDDGGWKKQFSRYQYRKKDLLKQQRLKIMKLRKDNETLLERIDEYQSKMKEFGEITSQKKKLKSEADDFLTNIEVEKKNYNRLRKISLGLENQIQLEQKRVKTKKNQAKVVNDQIKILENRLELNLKKLNKSVAENKKLRESIEKLRNEKTLFTKIYKKIELELFEKQREIAKTIDNSNKEYEQRDELIAEISKLKSKKSLKMWEFKKKLTNLQEIIDEDKVVREEVGYFEKKERRQENFCERKSKNDNRWRIATKKSKKVVTKKKIEKLRDLLQKIEKEVDIPIDKMIRRLKFVAESNFTGFCYINRLSWECEKNEKEILRLEKLIKSKKKAISRQSEVEKKIEQGVKKCEQIKGETAQIQKKERSLRQFYEKNVVPKIRALLQLVDVRAVEKVNFYNMMRYFGDIEERVMNIVREAKSKQSGSKMERIKDEDLVIVPPSTIDISNDMLSNEIPLDEKALARTSEQLMQINFFNKSK